MLKMRIKYRQSFHYSSIESNSQKIILFSKLQVFMRILVYLYI